MTDQVTFPELAGQIGDVVRAVMDDIRPRLVQAALSGDRSERANTRHADNFLSSYDLWAHDRYRQMITPLLPAGSGTSTTTSSSTSPPAMRTAATAPASSRATGPQIGRAHV